jgi:SAM-dependent methyltransferase
MGKHLVERIQGMNLTIEQWHERYTEQARWTASLREFIFKQINIGSAGAVLEVGCGTGAVLSSLPDSGKCIRFGLDILLDPLLFARNSPTPSHYLCGDGVHLPFADASFDVTYCHYLLLWLASPLQVLQEMRRVTRPGGYVAALAEPDYSSRLDHPASFQLLGQLQNQALKQQGVDLTAGRKLPGLFSTTGLHDVQSGVSGFQREAGTLPDWFDSEWQIIEHDLQESLPLDQLMALRAQDKLAWLDGSRVLWVPTFYAFARV